MCRHSHIEDPCHQAVTASEMSGSDWMLSPNLINDGSDTTHREALYFARTYGGTLTCTDIWRDFTVHRLMEALRYALMNKGTLLLFSAFRYTLRKPIGIMLSACCNLSR